jgi:hypothetical protein
MLKKEISLILQLLKIIIIKKIKILLLLSKVGEPLVGGIK